MIMVTFLSLSRSATSVLHSFFTVTLNIPEQYPVIEDMLLLEIASNSQNLMDIASIAGRVCDALSIDPLSHCCLGKGDKFPCQ